MKKKLLLGLTILLTIFLVTGCELSKKQITAEDFQKIGEDEGLIVVDVKEQFKDYDYVDKAIVGASQEGWQVEFYELSDKDHAETMFAKNKKEFQEEADGKYKGETREIGNYSTYILETDTQYMSLTRVNNTVLYAKVGIATKDTVVELIKKLGY